MISLFQTKPYGIKTDIISCLQPDSNTTKFYIPTKKKYVATLAKI